MLKGASREVLLTGTMCLGLVAGGIFGTAASAAPYTVGVRANGHSVLAGVDLSRRPVGALIERLGEPLTVPDSRNNACLLRWPELGLRVWTANYGSADPCSPEGGLVQAAQVTKRLWRTGRGLRVGDTVRRLRDLYPAARKRYGWWSLVTAYSPIGHGGYYPKLGARGARRVTHLLLQPGAAGD